MKTFSKCMAILMAVAGAATLAGCNKSTPNHKTATTANWNVRTSTAVEEDSFAFWQNNIEVASYDVTFTPGTNTSYEVSYNTASAEYVTKFYMLAEYDWSKDTIEEYQTQESEKEPVYVYETSLTISGSYKMGDDKFEFTDELNTTAYFRPAGKNLQPVYSEQQIKNTAPAALSANTLSAAYVQVDEVFKTYYNKNCSQATVVKTVADSDKQETNKISLSSSYSNFDNSQLRAALRAFTLSGGSSRTFYVVTPQNGNLQSVSASISSPVELNPLGTEDQQKILSALTDATDKGYLFFDGTVADKKEDEKNRNYRYNAVSLSINESLQGTSPAVWYTTVENNNINSTRCVLLKMSTPLAFTLGTLNYTLKSLTVEQVP